MAKNELTKSDWTIALRNVLAMREIAMEMGPTGMFYVFGCNELLARYDRGERTRKLYKEMKELH